MTASTIRRPGGRPATDLAPRLRALDVVLVCGSGGVGKTSIAATIALDEAMRGRRVCVLTVDPARRLADAMGIDQLEDREKAVPLPDGVATGGSLHALMLDPRTAFDRLIAETAASDAERDRVLNNRIYRQLSQSAAGVQEYMALERLYELDRSGRYDLLVVDTPPSAHARDLLDSPHRMLAFLEGRGLRWFLRPGARVGRLGLKAIGGSGGALMNVLQRVTGAQLLRDTTEFFESLEGMYGPITERIRVAERMFSSSRTGFVVVTGAERETAREAIEFWELLEERDLQLVATIVNRIEPELDAAALEVDDLLGVEGIDESLATRVVAAWQDHVQLAIRDRERLEELDRATEGVPVIAVPRLPVLVSDLDGLRELAPYVYGR